MTRGDGKEEKGIYHGMVGKVAGRFPKGGGEGARGSGRGTTKSRDLSADDPSLWFSPASPPSPAFSSPQPGRGIFFFQFFFFVSSLSNLSPSFLFLFSSPFLISLPPSNHQEGEK